MKTSERGTLLPGSTAHVGREGSKLMDIKRKTHQYNAEGQQEPGEELQSLADVFSLP